jgi:hypothetical protein
MNLGIFTRFLLEKLFRSPITTDLLGIFLLGLLFSSIYFNILSFWLPVNYFSLIPLALLSTTIFFTNRDRILALRKAALGHLRFFFTRPRLLISVTVLLTLFCFWIMAPNNFDSREYQFQSILWYEKFKVVPGLANIHGRFAFNPVSFILEAAYSFTGPAGQSLYPLNGVLMCLFSAWLLLRIFKAGPTLSGLLWSVLLVLLFRTLLINIPAPSSDTLVAVCVCYSLVSLFEALLSRDIRLSRVLVPCLLILYSLIAKLSSFPILLILPFIFFWLPKKERTLGLLLKSTGVALLLFLPWLARNYILSGYLVYPMLSLGWGHPDWQAPPGILKIDLFYIRTGAKTNSYRIPLSTPLPLYKWFMGWLNHFFSIHSSGDPFNFAIAIFSPIYWLFLYKKVRNIPVHPFLLWLILYTGVWIWLLTSPVIRFAVVFLTLAAILPLLTSLYRQQERSRTMYTLLTGSLFITASFFFIIKYYPRQSSGKIVLKSCWVYPLRDSAYNEHELSDFLFRTLPNGTKLYVADAHHECINACLPCMVSWPGKTLGYYNEIEMRGSRIDDGFRMIGDKVEDTYPFIK